MEQWLDGWHLGKGINILMLTSRVCKKIVRESFPDVLFCIVYFRQWKLILRIKPWTGNYFIQSFFAPFYSALWSRTAKNPDVSTGLFAYPFTHSLAVLTCSLARPLTHRLELITIFAVFFFLFWTIVLSLDVFCFDNILTSNNILSPTESPKRDFSLRNQFPSSIWSSIWSSMGMSLFQLYESFQRRAAWIQIVRQEKRNEKKKKEKENNLRVKERKKNNERL